jgi:DNA-binding transcriptional MerR regulator
MGRSLLSIGELARRVGAAPSALRYWERVGLLEVAERVGGRRRYAASAVTRIGMIRLCQDAGFHIGEIKALLDSDPDGREAWQAAAASKLDEVRATIARLLAAEDVLEHMLACPHPSLAECPSFTRFVALRAESAEPLVRHP